MCADKPTKGNALGIHCPRCGGCLFLDRIPYAHVQWACYNCGDRIDATILLNRSRARLPLYTAPRDYPIPCKLLITS